ncbi:MAG: HIT domain-containing protein [Gammaproteobacteria bacterium]|nr:HIT domain-containing protein [Gammaproteobacteria bacterium]
MHCAIRIGPIIIPDKNAQHAYLIANRRIMPNIQLDPRLKQDSHHLGWLGATELLLMRNSLFPWFVLVPNTNEIEFYKLDSALQLQILGQLNLVSEFVEHRYQIDKMNIGLIGNIVSQLHIHVIGRSRKDLCWPGVVWGVKAFAPYEPGQVEEIVEKLVTFSQGVLRIHPESGHCTGSG